MNSGTKFMLCLCITSIFLSDNLYSQHQSLTINKLPFRQPNSIDSGVLCLGGEIHDDGTYETGYGWNNTVLSGCWTIKFQPSLYPWYYTKVCLALARLEAGPDTFLFKLVVFDSLGPGGCPGAVVWSRDSIIVTNIAVWPNISYYQFTDVKAPVLNSGCYWIGIQYDPSLPVNFQKYICSDIMSLNGTWPGECYAFYNGTGSWEPIESYDPNYSCLAIRTEGSHDQPEISPCEGFNNIKFPPDYWTLDYSGECYWVRADVSGFGIGRGCALYDLWHAPQYTSQSLFTPYFEPTGTHDTLFFDLAYCSYPGMDDSLIILTSKNNGLSYNTLVKLGSEELNTTPELCESIFIPLPSQWERRSFVLPVKTNRIQFTGIRNYWGSELYIDSICIGRNLAGIIKEPDLPLTFSLSQNYPNPFNPVTKIKFDVPEVRGERLEVRMIIYDILGKEVATLVNDKLAPGTYEYEWDGSNYSSGVYFYKLIIDDASAPLSITKKMVLMK